MVQKSKGLWEIVSGTSARTQQNAAEWDKLDARAQEMIVLRMEEKLIVHILSCTKAADMWNKLKFDNLTSRLMLEE